MIEEKQYNNMTFMYERKQQPKYIYSSVTIYAAYIYNTGFQKYYAFWQWFAGYN